MANQTVLKAGKSYNVAVGAASVASGTNIGGGIRVVRLVSTVACWVVIGPSPTANTTTSVYLPAAWPEYFVCSANGNEQVAVIEAASAGTLNITEMTQ